MTQYSKYPVVGGGAGTWKSPVDTAASLPPTGNDLGDARAAEDTGVIYVWTGSSWDTAVAGVGTVTSVGLALPSSILTVSGSPVTGAGTLTGDLATQNANTAFMGPTSGGPDVPSFRALEAADLPVGTANAMVVYDSSGVLSSSPTLSIDTNFQGVFQSITEEPDDGGYSQINNQNINVAPLQDSPDEGYTINQSFVQLDSASSGFTFGTNGQAITIHSLSMNHAGTGDVGGLNGIQTNFTLGNGTDPISIKGIGYAFGFGSINANVTMDGPIQGYGFQPSFNASSVMGSNSYVNAFYDGANMASDLTSGYTSFSSNPNITSTAANNGVTSFNSGMNIDTIVANSSHTSFAANPNIDTIEASANYQGVSISPNITDNRGGVTAINVFTGNITDYPGVQATLTIQDLTWTFIQPGSDNNSITIEFANTATAGNETVTFSLPNIIIGIESGVSTATQVKNACDNTPSFVTNITTVISGTASNPQVTEAATNFTGGVNAGTTKAAQFDGDVSIDGALSFTGALSIGQLTSFAPYNVASSLGVASVDQLITAPAVAASATITGTDLLAINTAMLLTIGDNASVTSSFLGYAALGLPAVLSMGTGSTIDLVEGAVFAISLDAAATGGTVDEVDLCRSIAIPNGATTVNNLIGYKFDMPFGDVGTTSWGLYASPSASHNYMAGDLKVGSGADTPANSSVGIELESTTKAILMSRMTTAQKNALTAIAGMAVYDTDLNQLSYYNGTSWVNV